MTWAQFRARAGSLFEGETGIMGELGVVIEQMSPESLLIRLPFHPDVIGDVERNVVHSGVLMIMLDTVCGFSTMQKMPEPAPIATLDLRVDYLRAVPANEDVFVTANCYKLGHNVGFSKGIAYTSDPEDPAAVANGTFMLGTAGDPPPMAAAMQGKGG